MLSKNTRFRKNKRTAWRIIEGEGVLVDTDSGNFIHLNETAAEIWNSIDGTRTTAEIADHIANLFDVPPKTAATDTAELLEKFLKQGIIECPEKA